MLGAKEIKWESVEKLIPYAKNARTHSDEQVAQIAGSIKEFGFNNPVLVDKEGSIIAGHGRVMAARKLKMEQVPVVELTHLTESQRKACILADNRIALNSGWDTSMLSVELQDLKDDIDLSLLGFDPDELDSLLNPVEETEGLTDEDAVPEVPEEPKTKLGDIYKLGNHRLMCGDSTSITDVEKLVAGTTIDLCYTDPPYGINEKGDRSKRGGLTQGNNLKDFKDDTIDYAVEAYNIVEGVLKVQRQVWWGANYYCHALPQSNNWFVWDKRVEEKQKDTQSDCELAWVKSKWSSVRIFRHLWKGLIKGSEHGQKRVHPTQKPVALAEWAFDYFKEVSTVLDLFGGSGSTLIACEKTNRHCLMMEFEPHYCDVIVKRWEDFTGKKAKLVELSELEKRNNMQGVEHIPTEETRKLVRSLSAVGIKYVDIAGKLEISDDTLVKHYKKDLEDGRIDANASIGQTLFQQAKNGNTAAAIFWLKTRAQWKETSGLEVSGADGSPLVVKWEE